MLLAILISIFVSLVVLYSIISRKFNYWHKLGVRGPKPTPFFGNGEFRFKRKRHKAYKIQEIYECYKDTDNYVGIYSGHEPQLLITNAELVSRIFVSDFKHFHDNSSSLLTDKEHDFIFGNNPFVLTGETWKEKRAEVTAGLTIMRIKSMYPVTQKACKQMIEFIELQMKVSPKNRIDAKDLVSRLMAEILNDWVFGLEAKSFTQEPHQSMQWIESIFENFHPYDRGFLYGLLTLIPKLSTLHMQRLVPKEDEHYVIRLIADAIEMRKSQIKQNVNVDRLDFLNYLIQLQEKKNLSGKDLAVHAITFLFDGYETTSITLSHCLLLLARDSHRQDLLLEEIQKHLGSEFSFDDILELPYLDACIHESIRLFTPLLASHKICTEPINIANKNGETLMVPKGMITVLPVHAIMHDENFYVDNQSFVPERFLPENGGLKKFKDLGVYYGFGDGPRVCLGMRFALSQMKVALVEIIRHYRISVNEETSKTNDLDPNYFMSRIVGNIWLEFTQRY